MDLRIKTMTLQNFKGVSNKTYNLDKSVANLTGTNGSGKTTVLDAIMWLFANKDYARKHNPIVSTIGNEMADTTVTMSILMDGVEHIVSRVQTRDSNGKTSNNYFLDGVPKKDKELPTAYSDLGFDIELFLTLSHPDSFTGESAIEQRKVLMNMVKDIATDSDIANDLGFTELSNEMAEKSTADIKAIADNKRKSLEKVHGKKGVYTNVRLETLNNLLADFEKAKITGKAIPYIKDKIENLKLAQVEFNQSLADCEKVLYQLDEIENEKINRYEQEINKHFKNVNFKLWETQKDGQKVPCCKAMLDNFVLGESANTAREVLAKLEIITALAKHYGNTYPVLLDGAECLDRTSLRAIELYSQLIMATVSNSKFEIK